MKIGIVGNGFVGKATRQLHHAKTELMVYDIRSEECLPAGLSLSDMISCDVIFICVPTPMEPSGACHLSMVESVVTELRGIVDESRTHLVLRSTVPPGTCDRLGCYFMPEFLTEKRYVQDFIECPHWVMGLRGTSSDASFQRVMQSVLSSAKEAGCIHHDQLHWLSNAEAEMVKYVRNTYLATKVAFFNEMEEFCSRAGISYRAVREGVILDERVGASHTQVPGPDGRHGFGGTCFPKDTCSLLYQMKGVGMTSYVLQGAWNRNQKVDRVEADWAADKGRAVL